METLVQHGFAVLGQVVFVQRAEALEVSPEQQDCLFGQLAGLFLVSVINVSSV